MAQNPQLQEELELHQLVREGAKRAGQRQAIQQVGKRYHLRKKIVQGTIAVLVLTALAASLWFVMSKKSLQEAASEQTSINTEQIAQMEKSLPFDGIQAEYFTYEGGKALFESESGVLVSLAPNSLELNGQIYSGPALIQWQEAQEAAAIVKAGLSTTSGDRLLETQGMFSFQAFTPDGRTLDVNEKGGVYVQVPVNEIKKDMLLFEGIKGKNGKIDWQNPKQLEKLPTPALMQEMDLYPPGYEAKLDELKWHAAKKQRDSLYLSLGEDDFNAFEVINDNPIQVESKKIDSKEFEMDVVYSVDAAEGVFLGKQLFEQNCSTCHYAHKDGTGPKLFKVREKWLKAGAKPNSIYQWVWDWEGTAKNDPFVRKEIVGISPTAHLNVSSLKNKRDQIDLIYDYIDGLPEAKKETSTHIPPSKVLAIWKPKFNNTILATRDFEKRMKAIHATCSEKVFDVYANQPNKALWELDETVYKMGYPVFQSFAEERVGKIELDNAHMNNLRMYYQNGVKQLKEAAKKDRNRELKKRLQWDHQLGKSRIKEQERTSNRVSRALNEEYIYNLKNVYKQLGRSVGFRVPRARRNEASVMNIDRYVMNATIARQSTEIVDSLTNRTAKISYSKFEVSVKNATAYPKMYLYLFSKEINSFQRIDAVNGKFTYQLNDAMNYDMAIIGINESGYYYHELRSQKAGDLGEIALNPVSEKEFDRAINALNNNRLQKQMKLNKELDWLFLEQKDFGVQRKRKEQQAFRTTLKPIVFPCLRDGLLNQADSAIVPMIEIY
ncbi:MAG: hypothetical protein IT221_03260 [Fluviicola sp.]|nr:hypothetical protein [Fluviicola sp.]